MLKAKSLYHLIVYSILFIIILISFFTFIIINNAHEELQEKIHTLKNDYTDNQKELLKNEIEFIINYIDFYNNLNKESKSKEEIQNDIIQAIDKLKNNQNPNEYIFIYDFDGNVLKSSLRKDNIGKNFYHLVDVNGKEVIKELINSSKKEHGDYVEYIWYKPQINKETKKNFLCKSL